MQKSALVRTRRALRSAPEKISVFLSTLLSQSKSSQAPLLFVPLVGLAVDVTIRLKNVNDESLKRISSENKVGAFYVAAKCADTRHLYSERHNSAIHRLDSHVEGTCSIAYTGILLRVLSSSISAQSLLQAALHDFIETCISGDDFTNILLPAMEKSLLRSPEYSMNSKSPLTLLCISKRSFIFSHKPIYRGILTPYR